MTSSLTDYEKFRSKAQDLDNARREPYFVWKYGRATGEMALTNDTENHFIGDTLDLRTKEKYISDELKSVDRIEIKFWPNPTSKNPKKKPIATLVYTGDDIKKIVNKCKSKGVIRTTWEKAREKVSLLWSKKHAAPTEVIQYCGFRIPVKDLKTAIGLQNPIDIMLKFEDGGTRTWRKEFSQRDSRQLTCFAAPFAIPSVKIPGRNVYVGEKISLV